MLIANNLLSLSLLCFLSDLFQITFSPMKSYITLTIILCSFICFACENGVNEPTPIQEEEVLEEEVMEEMEETDEMEEETIDIVSARITGVAISGQENAYTFNVTIESPDTGCDQYADWWEVFTTDGTLIYRRILGHSHVTEQPFTRSGGSVNITAEQEIIVRAHMNNLGYGNQVYRGTVSSGLTEAVLDVETAGDLATTAPLPTECAF